MSLKIHHTAKVATFADIEESIRGTHIAIGEHSVIDSFVKFKPAGGNGNILIGKHVVINSGCVIYSGNGVVIGDYTVIAANCVIAPVNHEFCDRHHLIRNQGFKPSKGGILIEDDVWIGAGCILLDGTILRRGCVIGAMSLVQGEVEAYSIQAGNPLRLIRWRK
jgi:virginiamycin A acetyltransferase